MDVEQILDKLQRVKQTDNGWTASCPTTAHPRGDTRPGLHIERGDTGIVMHCNGQHCSIDDICHAIGIAPKDLFYDTNQTTRRRIATTYQYHDQTGTLLYETVRYDPKDFRQRRPDNNGGYIWNLKGVDRVIYRLPEVLAAVANNDIVYITEGEKDADALVEAGVCATTAPQGAGSWKHVAECARRALAGALVVVIHDQDTAGINHAKDIARSLKDVATVAVAKPYGPFNDAADHLAAGHNVTEFDKVAGPFKGVPTIADWLDTPADTTDETPWTLTRLDLLPSWRGERTRPTANVMHRTDGVIVFPPGINYVFGDSGDGKSWIMLVAALEQMRDLHNVIWVTYEDPNEDEIVDRLKLLGATETDLDYLHLFSPTEPFGTLTYDLATYARQHDATLLVLDSVGEANAVDGVNEDKDSEWGQWARNTIRRLYDLAIDDTATDGTSPVTSLSINPIDHSTKSKENPYTPSGTKRKRAMVTGLMVRVDVRQPFARDQFGRVQLVACKDRTGRFRRGEIVAEFAMDATVIPYWIEIAPPQTGSEMTTGKKRNATERVLEVINNANTALTADEVGRIVNGDDYRMSGEADLAFNTVRNTLTKLTGIIKSKEPTGTGSSYKITYIAEVGQ